MKKTFNNSIKRQISEYAFNGDINGIIAILENFLQDVTEIKVMTNEYFMLKFINWLKYGGKLPHTVFTTGNVKLPFLSFSTLPGVTCPGAGSCLDYCYSFKAWRQPAAFFRQVQNTLLMHDFKIIETEFIKEISRKKFSKLEKIDFRSYVDGDFSSTTDLNNWMKLLEKNSNINAYGYSKSLNLFLQLHDQGYKFPSNYVLNLSNGGKFDSLRPILKDLYFVRGNFTAINGDKKEIRKQFTNKIFVCPGKCGTCTNIGHACGNLTTFNNIEIVIPVH